MSTRALLEHAAFASHAWTEDDGRDNHALVKKICAALKRDHGLEIWIDAENIGAGSVTQQMSEGVDASDAVLIFLSKRYIAGIDGNWPPGKTWDNCQREYNKVITDKGYLKVVPVILDADLRDQRGWGVKAKMDLVDLIYYDISVLFNDRSLFDEKVAMLAEAIEQTRQGKPQLKKDAVVRLLQTPRLQPADEMAGAKLHGIEPVQRDWVLLRIKEWHAQTSWTRAFIILGDAGMGKSVIAATLALHGGVVLSNVPRRSSLRRVISKRFSMPSSKRADGFTVGAAHFFDYGNANTSDVRQVIYSIANQLCRSVPGLLQEIRQLDKDGLEAINDMAVLFRTIVAQPCCKVAAPGHRVVIILDALDECEKDARQQVLGILQGNFMRDCPDWFGFLATSRKEDGIPELLEHLDPTVLDADKESNVKDLQHYFDRELRTGGLAGAELKRATAVLTERSEGYFLYARFADTAFKLLQGRLTLEAVLDESYFAVGMSDTYKTYVGRFLDDCLAGSSDAYKLLFGALVVARSPLPLALVEPALEELLDEYDREGFEAAARNLLIVGGDGTLRFVHKGLADWVLNKDKKNPHAKFIMKERAGHKQLAMLCDASPQDPFALWHALFHLCKAGRAQEAAAHLLDVTWLLAALAVVDPWDLVLDADPFLDKPDEPAGDVLRVLEKGARALRHDPRQIASQLYGRLEPPHPALQSVDDGFSGSWLKPGPSLTPAQDPLRKTLVGHEGQVFATAYCHELDMIVSGSRDKTVKVWKASTGQLLRTLEGHTGYVNGVAVAAELDMIVSGSADKTVKVWKASTGQLLRTLEGHSRTVSSVAVAAELDMIVSGSWDKTVKVWKASTGQLLRTLEGHARRVLSVAVVAELDMIVSGSRDKTVKVWKASTGQLLRTLEGHSEFVNSVAVAAELDMIVSGSVDNTVKVWKASTGQLLRTLEGHSNWVSSVAVAVELDVIVSGSYDMTVKLWKASTGQLLRTLEGSYCYVAAELDMIVILSGDKTVKVWKASTGQLLRTLEGHSGDVTSVAVAAELDMIVSGSYDNTVKVWKASTGQLLRTLEGHSGLVTSVAVAVELDAIVSRSSNETLYWDIHTGEQVDGREMPGTTQGDAVTVDGAYFVSVPGQDTAGFTPDASVGASAVARIGNIIVVGDAGGRVHWLQLIVP